MNSDPTGIEANAATGGTPLAFGVYDPGDSFAGEARVSIQHFFIHWLLFDPARFATDAAVAERRGRRLLITVEPWTDNGWFGGDRTVMRQIAAGAYDGRIAAVCEAVGALDRPVYIRFAAEMDDRGDRYPWAHNPPADYISGFRHFVARCRAAAPKAAFLWSPLAGPDAARYYPGADVVDDIGLSIFGLEAWDLDQEGGPRRFADALGEKYKRVTRFQKPVIVAEFGVSGSDAYRRQWLAGLFALQQSFPLLRAIVYFNREETGSWPAPYGRPSWRLTPAEIFPP